MIASEPRPQGSGQAGVLGVLKCNSVPNLWRNSRKAARDSVAPRRPASLSFRERLHLSWELTWPLALLDAAVVVVIHGVIEARGETLDSIWALVAFFGVSPWVVQRALARRYGKWNIVVKHRGEETPRLKYQESLKVVWLLTWRVLPLALLAALVISGLLRLLRIPIAAIDTQDPLANALGLSVVDAVASLAFYPLLIFGMLRKHYRGFRLELKEFVPPRYAKPARKK